MPITGIFHFIRRITELISRSSKKKVSIMSDVSARPLTVQDGDAIERLCLSSAWSFQHYTSIELPRLLAQRPGWGLFQSDQLIAFILASSVVAPCAWLGGFGVVWPERDRALSHLDTLFVPWQACLQQRGVQKLYYSGYDVNNDWMHDPFLARGFHELTDLRSYDKIDYTIPTTGNRYIHIRPCDPARDLDALCALEVAAFKPLWRHDAIEFREIARDYPFFIIAEDTRGILGYQFSTVDDGIGYLVRIAVHPSFHSKGIGARLMAECMHYFAQEKVLRIVLNTENSNLHAQRLYEWFGFFRVEPSGYVLERSL
jgi:[ribosomal protein S18]-alanine N-acetyltransferase